MNNSVDTNNHASPTIADTLSESDKQNLHQAAQPTGDQRQGKGSRRRMLAGKGVEIANRWQQSNLRHHIQEHPVRSAGLVLLSGILIRSLLSRK
ncbi:hypothetical protein [Paraglaciecola sp. 20A4]|uniref:hypothetical protein n=1 Tax=Paraglaciecola sp. 20A4 TaxID=2687288 RepID=UPI00140D5A10|nr:hypothetical protein [Paraglaciecola sp. 20A4]